MSNILSAQAKKFTKWLIIRKEIKYKQELDLLNKDSADYNAVLSQMSKQNSDWLDSIHARHQIIMIGVMIVSIIGAVSTFVVTILKLF